MGEVNSKSTKAELLEHIKQQDKELKALKANRYDPKQEAESKLIRDAKARIGEEKSSLNEMMDNIIAGLQNAKNVLAEKMSVNDDLDVSITDKRKELNDLYGLESEYLNTVAVLNAIDEHTSLDSRQLDILIKLDYFADFGNQTELQKLVSLMETFKYGNAKSIRKEKVSGKYYEPLVQQYAVGTNKDGSESASYTFVGWNTEPINNAVKGAQALLRKAKKVNDTELITLYDGILNENKVKLNQAIKESIMKMLRTCETQIKSLSLPDVPLKTKIQSQMDLLGYIEIATGKKEDRRKLYIMKVRPLISPKTGQPWAYAVDARSVGSGITSNLTLMAGEYKIEPLHKGDIIYASQIHSKISTKTEIKYWYLDSYYKII